MISNDMHIYVVCVEITFVERKIYSQYFRYISNECSSFVYHGFWHVCKIVLVTNGNIKSTKMTRPCSWSSTIFKLIIDDVIATAISIFKKKHPEPLLHGLTFILGWISNHMFISNHQDVVVLNNLFIPKLQNFHRWGLGIDKEFHRTFYNV